MDIKLPLKNKLFYLDDLKIYANNDDGLKGLLNTVKRFSDDKEMLFGLDKYTKDSLVKSKNIIQDTNPKITELEHNCK